MIRSAPRRGISHKASGLRWLSLMLLVPIPWAGRVWALPFLTALAPSERYSQERGRRHKKLTDWARQLVLQARRWMPERTLVLVADSSFAALELLASLVRQDVTCITRLRLDAALYAPAAPRQPRTRGRPRTKGERLPTLATVLTDPATPWQRVVVPDWYGDASAIKILRSVVMKGLEALLLECLIGARRYGIEDAVLESLGKTLAKPFDQVVQGVLTTNAIHAGRRAEEAAMSAETLADVGLDSFVTRAVAERLRWVAELGMKEHFGGAVPLDWRAALDGIEEKLAGR